MAAVRFNTLKNLVIDAGWSFQDTNRYGKTGKSHLLQLRREGYVDYLDGRDPRITSISRRLYSTIRPYGTEKIANWYTITFKGMDKLLDLFPEQKEISARAQDMIVSVFKQEVDDFEIKLRS